MVKVDQSRFHFRSNIKKLVLVNL